MVACVFFSPHEKTCSAAAEHMPLLFTVLSTALRAVSVHTRSSEKNHRMNGLIEAELLNL